MAAMPANQKACYGVVVTGAGIPQPPANACLPPLGLHAGFAEPGGTLELEVPRGSNRKIELYAYIQNVGQNIPCPAFLIGLAPAEITKTYLVGTANNIDMSAETTVVDIAASFPGVANHIASQLAMPAACTGGGGGGGGGVAGGSPPGFHVSSGSGMTIEQGQTAVTGHKLIGRVGKAVPEQVLTSGDGHKLIVK